jgi:ribose 5-phosphate isomerase RpiB
MQAIACDETALTLTHVVRQQLKDKNIELKDFGASPYNGCKSRWNPKPCAKC